jgi:hypothetical protein
MKKILKTFAIGFTVIVGAMMFVGCSGGNKSENSSREVPTTFVTESATETTEAPTEEPTEAPTIETIEDAFAALEKDLVITNKVQQYTEMIGAIDGYSFDCNGATFELYIYEEGATELEDMSDGTLSYEPFEGYVVEINTCVNKNFVLFCFEEDAAVIDAFMKM